MNQLAEFIHAMEGALHAGVAGGDVIAVVRKMLAGRQARRFADDFFTFDDQPAAVFVENHPFSAQEGDRAVRLVPDRDEVNERMRLPFRQTGSAVMVDQPVQMSREAWYFERVVRHAVGIVPGPPP